MFAYTVKEDDSDTNGASVAHGRDNGGYTMSSTQSIKTTDDATDVSLLYGGLASQPGHKVDGSITNPPVFVSAQTNTTGNKVIITFSKDISLPPLLQTIANLFNVNVGKFYASVFDVYTKFDRPGDLRNGSISGKKLTLTLQRRLDKTDDLEVAYNNIFARDSVGMFLDTHGNALQNFGKQEVTNRSNSVSSSLGWPFVNETYEKTVQEGGTATYRVKLSHPPVVAADVNVTMSVYPAGAVTVSPTTFSLNRNNNNPGQLVTITAAEDDDTYNMWTRVTATGARYTYGGNAEPLRTRVLKQSQGETCI